MRKTVAALIVLGLLLGWLTRQQASPDRDDDSIHAAIERTSVALHAAGQALSHRLIAQHDAPPAGTRSLFDHHLAQAGGLPYPFAALLESFNRNDRWDDGYVSLLIPQGRSLSKGQTDFRQPRVLAAARTNAPYSTDQLAPIYAGRLFLGFTEAAQEIEVIAYNEAAGRFEFQLVQNYCAGCTPRVVYARRAVCLACHQSGAPIFSVRPWAETNASMPVARKIAQARGVDWSKASATRYHGAALSTQILMPETFDELVRAGSELIQAQRLWIDGCGENGLHCRRRLLAQTLFLLLRPGEFDPASSANTALRQAQAQHWPDNGIALPNDSLPSREPLIQDDFWLRSRGELKNVVRRIQTWFRFEAGDNAELSRKLAAFERQPKLPAALDPLTPREPSTPLSADSLTTVHRLAGLFVPDDRRRLLEWSGDSPQRVRDLILGGQLDELLSPGPVNRVAILQALAQRLGQAQAEYCCLENPRLAPPLIEGARALNIEAESVLSLFQRYCFACHRGNPVEHLNFMGAGTVDAVLAAIRAKPQIRERLDFGRYEHSDWRSLLMPPAGSSQRRQLDAARASGADDLEQMQEFMRQAQVD